MRKIREVLRLKFDSGLSVRKISRSLGIGHSSAGDYLCRFAASGLAWPCSLSDSELEQQLFPPTPAVPSEQRPLPDWSWVHAELRRPGVTLALLWQEYRLNQPQGFQYSWFCEHYRAWQGKLDVVMRQEHRVGENRYAPRGSLSLGRTFANRFVRRCGTSISPTTRPRPKTAGCLGWRTLDKSAPSAGLIYSLCPAPDRRFP